MTVMMMTIMIFWMIMTDFHFCWQVQFFYFSFEILYMEQMLDNILFELNNPLIIHRPYFLCEV